MKSSYTTLIIAGLLGVIAVFLYFISVDLHSNTYFISADGQTFINKETKKVYHYNDAIGYYQLDSTGIKKIKTLP